MPSDFKPFTHNQMEQITIFAKKCGFTSTVNYRDDEARSAIFNAEKPSFPIKISYSVFSYSAEIQIFARPPNSMDVEEAEKFAEYITNAAKIGKKLEGKSSKKSNSRK